MASLITTCIVGIIMVYLSVVTMRGNISLLHSYHRHRVTEENKKPFAMLTGLGLLICGISCISYGVFIFVYEKTMLRIFSVVSMATLIVGIAVGLIISFYAMIKYNKGIF